MREDRQRMVSELAIQQAAEMSALLDRGDGLAREEFKRLMTWIPECLPESVIKSYEQNGARKGEVPPFFCEVTLYELLGKDQARTLLSLMNSLGEALGFDGDRDLIDEAQEGDLPNRKSLLTHEDIDTLEGFMRHEASYAMGGGSASRSEKIIRITKTIPILRDMVDEPREDWCWKKIWAPEIRVGDRIFSSGRFIEVHGFLTSDKKPTDRMHPYGDWIENKWQVPRGLREKYGKDKKYRYWAGTVMTEPGDTWGWSPRTQDPILVQRLKETSDD